MKKGADSGEAVTKEDIESDVFEDEAVEEEEHVEDQAKPLITELVIPTNISELVQKKSKGKPQVKTSVKINKRPKMTQSSLEEELADE